MPASIPFSSQLPKFPDGKRRPGIIQLSKPPSTPPRTTVKLPNLNTSQKSSHQQPQQAAPKIPGIIALPQLRTPSPSPRKQSGQNRRRQKRSSLGNNIVIAELNDVKTQLAIPLDVDMPVSKNTTIDRPVMLLSPPPTPAARKSQKKAKPAPPVLVRTAAKGRRSTAASSPPTTPGVNKFEFTPLEAAVFPLSDSVPLLPPVDLTEEFKRAQISDDSLPLADDDEVIIWKQPPVTTTSVDPAKPVSLVSPRTPSPTVPSNATWDDVKNLPRLSPATVAKLKEEYDIRPSKAFQRAQTMTQEPDLLSALLMGSSSAPSTPGNAAFPTSKPIPITRPIRHGRTPSVPLMATTGRIAENRADVADIFGLDIRDQSALDKAAEAWKAYAGSAFNVSPPDGEHPTTAPKPKFLGRLFN